MSRRSMGIALTLSLALNLSAIAALAYYRWGVPLQQRASGGSASVGSLKDVLGLAPEQEQQVQAIQQAFLREAAPLRAKVQSKNIELMSAAIAGGADQARTSRLLAESAAFHRQIQTHALRYLSKEAKVLVPEQREALAKAISTSIRSGACPLGGGAGMGMKVLGGPPPEKH